MELKENVLEEQYFCPECKEEVDIKTQDHVWDSYVEVYSDRWGERNFNAFSPFHSACLDNIHKPEHLRICDVCSKQGKDATGNYPGFYRYGRIEHGACIDWDDERHLQQVMKESRYE